jgi:hypothetical protein
MGSEPPGELYAVHVRHVDVGDDQVRRLGLQDAERLLAVDGGLDEVAPPGEKRA